MPTATGGSAKRENIETHSPGDVIRSALSLTSNTKTLRDQFEPPRKSQDLASIRECLHGLRVDIDALKQNVDLLSSRLNDGKVASNDHRTVEPFKSAKRAVSISEQVSAVLRGDLSRK